MWGDEKSFREVKGKARCSRTRGQSIRGYFFCWSKQFMSERPECLGYLGSLRARRGNRAGLKIKAGLQYASQAVPLEDLTAEVASRHLASTGLDLDFT